MPSTPLHISVCVCTYKRPELLKRLLERLQEQETENLFIYSVVIVDNDERQSARDVVGIVRETSSINIDYNVEPEKNIALARNKAIDNASGQLIAFLDDDEFPISTWLLSLYNVYKTYKVDGVLGPVKPHFDSPPPDWIIKGRFCERDSYDTGTVLNWNQTRTGNVLFNKTNMFDKSSYRFEKEFGITGGEDMEFFKKAIGEGMRFIWCNEAVVYETVTPDRWKEIFYFRKSLRIGGLTGEKVRNWESAYKNLMIAFLALFRYTITLPFSFMFGKHIYMKYLMKVIYYFGWISGFFGFVIVRFRSD